MPALPITFACGLYDRMLGFIPATSNQTASISIFWFSIILARFLIA
jgi:hypothetical protein